MSTGTKIQGQHDTLEITEDDHVDVADLADGSVVTGQEDGATYMARGGKLQRVFDPMDVLRAGFDPDSTVRLTLPTKALKRFITRPDDRTGGDAERAMAAAVTARNFNSGDVFLGAGHYMRTWGQADSVGRLAATTNIRTITWFGGFHGQVNIIFANSGDAPVYASGSHRYGVDGTWVGTSNRTEAWFEDMDAARFMEIRKIYIFHAWAPDNFQTILDKWVNAGKSVGSLAGSVGAVAAVVAAIV